MIPAGYKGRAVRLEDIDLPRIGHEIGVGEDVIHAIMDVEARSTGFDDQGRPRILFEPHIFYRYLTGAQRDRAVREGLAYKSWKPGTYGTESAQYGKLDKAAAINRPAALYACSWGRSQIMGFNHASAGFETIEEMVAAFCDDEDNHIEAMIRFVQSAGIAENLRRIDALKRPTTPDDWRPVALRYNGEGYEANKYHIKLCERFEWWRKKPDTLWTPGGAATPAPAPAPSGVPAEVKPAQGWFARFFGSLFGALRG